MSYRSIQLKGKMELPLLLAPSIVNNCNIRMPTIRSAAICCSSSSACSTAKCGPVHVVLQVPTRTQVAIIGAGPAGLVLGQLLAKANIDNIILEHRSAEHVLRRFRAGLIEPRTVHTLERAGAANGLLQNGLVQDGTYFTVDDNVHHIDFKALVGASLTAYDQTRITIDLMTARESLGLSTLYEVSDVSVEGFDSSKPLVKYSHAENRHELQCDFIAGCDGFRGVTRQSIPPHRKRLYEHDSPLTLLGILSATPPAADELVYGTHPDGFALCSIRSQIESRYYIQVSPEDQLEQWPDNRFWDVLGSRLNHKIADSLVTGTSKTKSLVRLRSFVCEPMKFGTLFLAGDAAHILPPTGAKGLNLAVSDVSNLAEGFTQLYHTGNSSLLTSYSDTCLKQVWKANRFSWWLTSLTFKLPGDDEYAMKIKSDAVDELMTSHTAQTIFAKHYVGISRYGDA